MDEVIETQFLGCSFPELVIGLEEDLVIRIEEVLENLLKAKFMKKLNIWQEIL